MDRSRPLRCMLVVAIAGALAAPAAAVTAGAGDLFDAAELHDIWIHINARDWAQLRETFQENTYYPCDVEWRGMKVHNAGCRSRGYGSRSGVKPGLRVDFNHYVAAQAFLGLESIVLDNLTQDPSMIKERLSMRLVERLGLPAPREAHARLYVGSEREYTGVYAVVEEIDRQFLQRWFGEHDGHLYEYRWIDEYRFEDLGADFEPYAARFEPRTHEHDSPFSLYAPIRDLVRVINDARAEELETALSPYLDVRALVAQLAAENYLSDWDGLLGYAGLDNFYLYRFAQTGLSQLLVWDKDRTFSWLEMPPWHNVDTNVLTRKIWAVPELRRAYLQVLLDAAAAADGLEREALRAYEQIRVAALEDPLKPYSNEEFEQAVESVSRFTRERGDVVRRWVRQLAPTLAGTPPRALSGTSRFPHRGGPTLR